MLILRILIVQLDAKELSEELTPTEVNPECRAQVPCSRPAAQQQRLLAAMEGAATPYRQLETSLLALRLAIEGCGPAFEPHFDEALLDLLAQAAQHPSRFVRECTFHLLNSLIAVCAVSRQAGSVVNGAGSPERKTEEDDECCEMELDIDESTPAMATTTSSAGRSGSLERFSVPLCQMLASGLADSTENWAQVR